MAVCIAYPYYDISNWEFADGINVAHKGYKTFDEPEEAPGCDGLYVFKPTKDGHYEIEVKNRCFEDFNHTTIRPPISDIIAASLVCTNGKTISITQQLLDLRVDGKWFSGYELSVHELIPYFCEMTEDFAPLLYFDVLRLLYLDPTTYDIKHIDFEYYDIVRL